MRNNTPPHSPATELIDDDDDELIYIGDADEVLADLEAQEDENEDEDEELEGNDEFDEGHPSIPEHDDSIMTFTKHDAPVFCGSLHPSENIAVTGGEDDNAYVWNIETGEIIFHATEHKDTVIGAEFSYDGNYLATGDLSGYLQVYKLSSNYKKVWEFVLGDMIWMKWHPKSNVLMAGSENGEIYIWRIPSGDCKVLQGYGKKCEVGILTADGRKLIAGYGDGNVKLWDIKNTNIELDIDSRSPYGHTESITCICTDQENSIFVTGSEDGKLMICSHTGPIGNLYPNSNIIETVTYCTDNELKLIVSGTLQGKLTIWDLTKQTVRSECIDNNPIGITISKWLKNEQTLIVGTLLGNIKGFDVKSGQMKFLLNGHTAEIYDLNYNKETKLILTCSEDKTAKIFRLP